MERWGTYHKRLKNLDLERAEAYKMLEGARDTVKAHRARNMPTSKTISDISDVLANVEQLEQDYAELVRMVERESAALIRRRSRLESAVRGLPKIQEDIIVARYRLNKSWQMISEITKYEESHVRRLERAAVDAIADALDRQKKLGA